MAPQFTIAGGRNTMLLAGGENLPVVPTAITQPATGIGHFSADLNALVNPHGLATTVYFEVYDDSGTTQQTTPTPVGSGHALRFVTHPITGLRANAQYFYRAIATNSVGSSAGKLVPFLTEPDPGTGGVAPTVSTEPAHTITITGATLAGSANPNGTATNGWFEYRKANSADPTWLTTATQSLGAGSAVVAFSKALTGLTTFQDYEFRAVAANGLSAQGEIRTFKTLGNAPVLDTLPASSVVANGARANATVDAQGLITEWQIAWGPVGTGFTNTFQGGFLPGAFGAVTVQALLTGLIAGQTYEYRVEATNVVGTTVASDPEQFTTTSSGSAPLATTLPATNVGTTVATLNASVHPGAIATTIKFFLSGDGGLNFVEIPVETGSNSSVAIQVSVQATSLLNSTAYRYYVQATNSKGTATGALVFFTTEATISPPIVATQAATAITKSSATLNGNLRTNGSPTNGYFQYGLTTAYGQNTNPELFTAGGLLPVAHAVTGLTPGKTYHYRSVAVNSAGGVSIVYGVDLSFRTVEPPEVHTSPEGIITENSFEAKGTVNPNGLPAVGHFEYGLNSVAGFPLSTTDIPLGSGVVNVPLLQQIRGLLPNTVYKYRAVATNDPGGTTIATEVELVTTLAAGGGAAPSVTINPPITTPTTVQFWGDVNPNGLATDAWFEYRLTSSSVWIEYPTVHIPVGSGVNSVQVAPLPLQLVEEDYECRLVAENTSGKTISVVMPFTIAAGTSGTGLGTKILPDGLSGQTHANVFDETLGFVSLGQERVFPTYSAAMATALGHGAGAWYVGLKYNHLIERSLGDPACTAKYGPGYNLSGPQSGTQCPSPPCCAKAFTWRKPNGTYNSVEHEEPHVLPQALGASVIGDTIALGVDFVTGTGVIVGAGNIGWSGSAPALRDAYWKVGLTGYPIGGVAIVSADPTKPGRIKSCFPGIVGSKNNGGQSNGLYFKDLLLSRAGPENNNGGIHGFGAANLGLIGFYDCQFINTDVPPDDGAKRYLRMGGGRIDFRRNTFQGVDEQWVYIEGPNAIGNGPMDSFIIDCSYAVGGGGAGIKSSGYLKRSPIKFGLRTAETQFSAQGAGKLNEYAIPGAAGTLWIKGNSLRAGWCCEGSAHLDIEGYNGTVHIEDNDVVTSPNSLFSGNPNCTGCTGGTVNNSLLLVALDPGGGVCSKDKAVPPPAHECPNTGLHHIWVPNSPSNWAVQKLVLKNNRFSLANGQGLEIACCGEVDIWDDNVLVVETGAFNTSSKWCLLQLVRTKDGSNSASNTWKYTDPVPAGTPVHNCAHIYPAIPSCLQKNCCIGSAPAFTRAEPRRDIGVIRWHKTGATAPSAKTSFWGSAGTKDRKCNFYDVIVTDAMLDGGAKTISTPALLPGEVDWNWKIIDHTALPALTASTAAYLVHQAGVVSGKIGDTPANSSPAGPHVVYCEG